MWREGRKCITAQASADDASRDVGKVIQNQPCTQEESEVKDSSVVMDMVANAAMQTYQHGMSTTCNGDVGSDEHVFDKMDVAIGNVTSKLLC